MWYVVGVREVWTHMLEVEAESSKDALKKVQQGKGKDTEDTLTYSHTLDKEQWTVNECTHNDRVFQLKERIFLLESRLRDQPITEDGLRQMIRLENELHELEKGVSNASPDRAERGDQGI